jgi:hypothetical protein
MRIARWAFTIFLAAPLAASLVAVTALAQDQDNSLAAAARRAQEQKKDQPKAAKVYDNDTIPTNGPVNVVGQEPPAGGSNATADTSNAITVESSKPAPTAAEIAELNSDLASGKQRLADLKADLDVARRKYALDQQTYLSDPNHSMNKAGATSLDAEKSDIDAKAAAVADAEKALAAVQAKVDQTTKESAAAAQAKSAQEQQQNSAAAAPQPNPPQQTSPPSNPDSGTATVNRQ